jgi:hypothetical protein
MATAELVPVANIEKNVLTTTEYAAAIAVATHEQYTEACDFIKAVARTRKEVEDTFGPIKQKAHAAWKETVAQENKFLAPLDQATTLVKGKIGSFLAEQERQRRAEEEKAREIARKEAEDRAIAEAAELARQGESKAAEQVIEQAVSAPAPVVVIPNAVQKQEGIATRKVWKYRIVNTSLIPREYLAVDEQKIGQVVRAMKDMAKIPGVEVYSEDTVSVRG